MVLGNKTHVILLSFRLLSCYSFALSLSFFSYCFVLVAILCSLLRERESERESMGVRTILRKMRVGLAVHLWTASCPTIHQRRTHCRRTFLVSEIVDSSYWCSSTFCLLFPHSCIKNLINRCFVTSNYRE